MNACPVDNVVTGSDYDFLIANLCNYLEGKTTLEGGIYYRENGVIKNTESFNLQHNQNTLPLIDRDLVKRELYAYKNGNFRRTPSTYNMAGRDCWHGKCTFYSWTTLYPEWCICTPEVLLDEVGHLINSYGVVEIMDDNGSFPTGQWLRRY